MTVDAINKYIKPYLAENIEKDAVFHIQTTSVNYFYTSRMEDIQFDDTTEIMSFRDVDSRVLFHIDYSDINIVARKDKANDFNLAIYS
ncbi:hypothetical protein AR9_g023 [Bacillus phage AR9]|uniref:Uncharacterized protein n=2 Tax=Bacillus phage PBS1 TaxID=10683 RepID=A0A172JHT3_BPPB1|nr:hypothetical protein BI022_gp023 [Bacillus phage AR9]YP_009664409.1 hypothetical protein FK780_gp239 [Bacillus phage PBS1]PTU25880.1 hypothetical protein DA469_21415 [Bacillus subtilis]QXN70239.1 hypothetical protein INTERNEXUS_199 [Bacillus phage vB_BspM_Internexus]WCS68134.1 hypothetical protein Goe21_00240 [Bacillus phage vB_BsuM-Goe21]AMS01108.1 hypothetical protein AR9_g023 [Bacillus phage AR9]ASU00030.1 hypothetical protein PBI_PBS1_208 [Bacillus phage PBS1]